MLDSLFDDDEVNMPFTETVPSGDRRFLCAGLLRRDIPQYVLDPVPPSPWSSDESSSDDDAPITMDDHSFFDGVTSAYAPRAQSSQNSEFDYQVKDREPATDPPLKKMIIEAPNGHEILVVPRCLSRKKITRGCVELAVSQWMREQQNLPPGAPGRVDVPTGTVSFEVDGEIWPAPVWLWRGLERIPHKPGTYKLHL